MTRGASPETSPHVVRLFCCQANDAVVVCTHCIQSAAVRYTTATLRTRAARSAAGIRLRQSIVKSSGMPAFLNPQVIALHVHNQEDQDIGNLHFRSLKEHGWFAPIQICHGRETVWPVTRPVQVMWEWCPRINAHPLRGGPV